MNVVFISQCSGNARTETRRVLDTFAERCGDGVWQTPITQQGLETVHTLLRATARRNTAVICRWIHGVNHSEVLWTVGNAHTFNEYGAVPTNTSRRDVLRAGDEDTWLTLEDITLIVRLAALFHDFGKATKVFQKKLQAGRPVVDAFRHEWVSVRLLQALLADAPDDRVWLSRLAQLREKPFTKGEIRALLQRVIKDDAAHPATDCWKVLPPLAKLVAWLMLGHHRMPLQRSCEKISPASLHIMPAPISAAWGYTAASADANICKALWKFTALPLESSVWCARAARLAQGLLARPDLLKTPWLENVFALHLGRMALMLADHEYSSRHAEADRYAGDAAYAVYANTNRKTGELSQRLDEHLIGVEKVAASILRILPHLRENLPVLGQRRSFRQRCALPRFQWQDKAFDLCAALAERTREQGFFGVNIASTGCGKTFANGRICYALAREGQARFTVALGLRTLTLQTGHAYRSKLGLGAADVGILAGGAATRQLYGFAWGEETAENKPEEESYQEALLPEDAFLDYLSGSEHPLQRWLSHSPDAVKLLEAPILCCTVDHLINATEGIRGGRQIAPMLRLLTADLVLDEPDDFSPDDLYALTRLVYWSGMLGGRVLLSSATIPEALAAGLFAAYQQGRTLFGENCGGGRPAPLCCAWFDEFGASSGEADSLAAFQQQHRAFVEARVSNLAAREAPRRHAAILPLDALQAQQAEGLPEALIPEIWGAITRLHDNNAGTDPETGKRLSCGLVRMANIDPLIDVVQALLRSGIPEGWHVHLCCYHSRYPLCMRSKLEYVLDNLLRRDMSDAAFFGQPRVRQLLAQSPAQQHIVLVLATPVAEVGRDHDYDWALVEPSSVRSLVQLAGRVRRHRPEPWERENICVWSHNFHGLHRSVTEPVFCRPGFESKLFPLESHDLRDLLTREQLQKIDASLRILERSGATPRQNLADRELEYLRQLMLGGNKIRPVHEWWLPHATLCGEIQRATPFRKEQEPQESYVFYLEEGDCSFRRIEQDGSLTPCSSQCAILPLDEGYHLENVSFLVQDSYKTIIAQLAEQYGKDETDCSQHFGRVTVPQWDQGWMYYDCLGLRRRR